MANSTQKIALLAAGYLLGRSKGLKSVLLVAGGVAYGRLVSQQGGDGSSGSVVGKFTESPELQRVTSGLAEAARGAFAATASKGVETLNETLQNRTAALRDDSESQDDDSSEADNATDTDEAASQDAEESKDSEEASVDAEATESGGR